MLFLFILLYTVGLERVNSATASAQIAESWKDPEIIFEKHCS